MANGNEVARCYVTIVPTMQGAQKTIAEELGATVDPAADSVGESSGKRLGDGIAKGLKATGAVIAGALTAATGAAIAMGKGFIDAAGDVASYGDQVDKMSQKMGISATAYQEWDYVMQHCGTSIDTLKSSMKTLATAAESGNAAFQELGLSQEQIANMSQEELFAATIEGLQNVEDTTQRTYLAGQLLGRGATELGALLNMSASDTQALKGELSELGGLMSDEAVKDAATYQDSLQDMQVSLTGLKNNMMSQFLPAISKVMNGLSSVFSGKEGGIEEIQAGVQDITANIAAVSPQLLALASAIITSLISSFGPLLPQVVESFFTFANQALLTVVQMIPQLTPVITSGLQGLASAIFTALPVLLAGLGQVVMGLVTWLSEGDNVTNFVNGVVQLCSQLVEQFALLLPILLPAIVQIIGDVVTTLTAPENIELLVQACLTIIGAIVVALINAVPEIIDFVVGVIENLGNLLGDFLSWIVPKVAEGIGNVLEKIKEWGTNVKTNITNLVNNVKTTFTNWIENLKTSFSNGFNAIKTSISNTMNKIKEFVTQCINKIKELPSKVVSIGKNLVEGLWNGINDKIGWVKQKIASMGSAITSAIKKVFGIASPSKVWKKEVGRYLADGLAIGFVDEMDAVEGDIIDRASELTGNMTASVEAYAPQPSSVLTGNEVNNNYGGNISINVYGAEGQSETTLAEAIADKLGEMTRRRGAVYA